LLPPNTYDLLIGDGKDAKSRTIEIGPARTITALLEADPNVGALLIQANEDGATVILLANGKELARKVVQNHQVRFANLHARAYNVQVQKDGYEGEGEKPVDVVKGAETPLSFELHRKVTAGTIHVQTSPGADVFLDNEQVGSAEADGMFVISGSRPGSHKVEARLKLYATRATSVSIGDGETKAIELVLSRNPGTVSIQREPASSVVTYRRTNDTVEKTAAENQLTLPEGTYLFTATAPGHLSNSLTVVVRAEETAPADLRLSAVAQPVPSDPMGSSWEKGLWTQSQDWYVHKGDSFIGVTRPGPATIEFVAALSDSGILGTGHKLVWATSYLNNRNYVRYELSDKNLTITTFKDGRGVKSTPKSVKPVAKYAIRLEWRPDSIMVNINGETIAEVKGEFQGGRFGFLQNKEVRMQNFRLEAGNSRM